MTQEQEPDRLDRHFVWSTVEEPVFWRDQDGRRCMLTTRAGLMFELADTIVQAMGFSARFSKAYRGRVVALLSLRPQMGLPSSVREGDVIAALGDRIYKKGRAA